MTRGVLEGKVAVVTGGSEGIGRAVAAALHQRGACVVLGARSAERLDTAAGGLVDQTDAGQERLSTRTVDVRDAEQVEQLIAHAVDRFGGLDVLVNNAGVGVFGAVSELSLDDWRTVIETNLHGVFHACRSALPRLRERGGGWIINVSSLAGSHPFVGGGAYCTSKAGLDAFTAVLMQEVRHDEIRVSTVAPGSVDTRFGGSESGTSPWKLHPDDVARVVTDLLAHDPRSLPSRVEIRPARPRR